MNNETKHTPEPWQYTESGVTMVSIIEPDGHTIFHCDTLLNSTAQLLKMENARRIVACVNACEGIGTETLETERSYVRGRRGLLDQRDELAAVLREFVTDCDRAHGKAVAMALSQDWPDLLITYTKAKATLAKL